MIIAGKIKVLCRVLILPAFCAFMLQTLPLMGAFYVIDQIFGKFFC